MSATVWRVAHYEDCYQNPDFNQVRLADRLASGPYRVYHPDTISDWSPMMPPSSVSLLTHANQGLERLNADFAANPCGPGLARWFLSWESTGSSRLEDVESTASGVATAAAFHSASKRGRVASGRHGEIYGNILAMEEAVRLGRSRQIIRVEDLCGMHKILMDRTSNPRWGGVLRDGMIFVGGSQPSNARYVAPPHQLVGALLEDLVKYVNDDRHAPLVQAAMAHAHFEAIHPFSDGNGRAGRALVHVILQRREPAYRCIPPISTVLSAHRDEYFSSLNRFCHEAAPDSSERSAAAMPWSDLFMSAVAVACDEARQYASSVSDAHDRWASSLGTVTRNSATERVLRILCGIPVFDIATMARVSESSVDAVEDSVRRLSAAGIVEPMPKVKSFRQKFYRCPEVLDMCDEAEDRLRG